jgi:hypothetical protein
MCNNRVSYPTCKINMYTKGVINSTPNELSSYPGFFFSILWYKELRDFRKTSPIFFVNKNDKISWEKITSHILQMLLSSVHGAGSSAWFYTSKDCCTWRACYPWQGLIKSTLKKASKTIVGGRGEGILWQS